MLVLNQICKVEKRFGSSPGELEVLVDGFLWILGEYDCNRVFEAFKHYVMSNNDIPTPSDIVKIVEKPSELNEEQTFIQKLGVLSWKRKMNQFLNIEEFKILNDWETRNGKVNWNNYKQYLELQQLNNKIGVSL